ncbi:transporter substrate-binding domain-containing protein [Chrysiogenes arsenatis]|uniref:transporter substrate-binding domain-containing protein n=1 Tax=Chrysiogenes arsenatis TaxID=309797 RepID=UPI0003FC185C|nr:transporter substrate-binding domain-containing protein [Chrysiogenes arsenatis]
MQPLRRTTRHFFGFTFLCCLLVFAVKNSFARPEGLQLTPAEKEFLDSHHEIVFVSQTHYPPFEFIDDYGTRSGMMIELARWISSEVGFHARFIDTSFLEAQQALLSGEADILTSFLGLSIILCK